MPGESYEGKSIRDIVIELTMEMKAVHKLLEGNGEEGLCTRVDKHDIQLAQVKVYIAIVAGSLAIGVPLLTEVVLRVLGV